MKTNWKKMLSKAVSVVKDLDAKYESACARIEVRITGGSTLDNKVETVLIPAVKQYAVVCAKHTCTVIDNLPATTVVGAVRQGAGYIVALSERTVSVIKDKVSHTADVSCINDNGIFKTLDVDGQKVVIPSWVLGDRDISVLNQEIPELKKL
jgi:hypothetical protein